MLDALRLRRRRLDLERVWKLVNAPIDAEDGELLGVLAAALAGDTGSKQQLRWLLDPARLHGASLEEAEAAGRQAGILRWFALQFDGTAGVTLERAAALEQAAADAVVEHLRAEIAAPTIGRCRSCGAATAPWAALCDRCFMAHGYRAGRR